MGMMLLSLLLLALGVQDPKPLAVGDPVPDFVVADLSGGTVKLSELRARAPSGVVSLTFWCTFCHSCRMLDAKLQKRADDHKGRAAVAGVDASAVDDAKKIGEFAKAKGFTVPVFLDAAGKAADLFGVKVTTTTMIIDQAGVLRYRGTFDGAGDALAAVLEGKDVAVRETPPKG